MVRPRSVAIIGASAKRATQGNVVIANLRDWGYGGTILPVHPQASEIDGLPAFNSVAALPENTDVAIVAIPAALVAGILDELEASTVRSAIVFSNGFTPEDERRIREMGKTSRLVIHGPNCMGLINFNENIPLYPARPSRRLRPGKVALIAQSGSAAISILNSIEAGVSKVMTMGSEFQVAAADYVRWLADDDDTSAIGIVAESIKDPVALADAAEAAHAAGKPVVVLKVGRSATGLAATQAHTGALVSPGDAYDDFFASTNIATVADYDELVASLECAAMTGRMVGGSGIGIVGISGGQTALACDIADDAGIEVAGFEEATAQMVAKALPGTNGRNPIDFGATVNPDDRDAAAAITAVLDDPNVGAVVAFQDMQDSLNPAGLANYMGVMTVYAEMGRAAKKPFVMISPTSERIEGSVRKLFDDHGVPLLRGLTPGLRAAGNLRLNRPGPAGAWAKARLRDGKPFNPKAEEIRRELSCKHGSLDPETSFRILRDYGLPVVKSIVVADADEAVRRAGEVGYPMVVKVASTQIQHRSDVGGVKVDIGDDASLRDAIESIRTGVSKARPEAVIDGFELQEQLVDCVEAVAGFTSAAPFGQLVVVGTGGTMVEITSDRSVKLAPFDAQQAAEMIGKTKLASYLSGYRNLIPATSTEPLAQLTARLSELASDLDGVMIACDVNPVLVRKGSGEVRIVDALCITA
jgi:acyl-CoA synthetase (NDP forming)